MPLHVTTKLFDFVDENDPLNSPPPGLRSTDYDSSSPSSSTRSSYTRSDSPTFSFYTTDSSKSESSNSSQCGDSNNNELDQGQLQAPLILTIKGLYTNAVIPGARFLPRNFTDKDHNKHQFMCRKRIHTKPLPSSTSDDNDTAGTQSGIIGNEHEHEHAPHQEAMFLPGTGLVNGYFWHLVNKQNGKGVVADRAILFQSEEHYERIIKDPRFSSCFDDIDYKTAPSFGEQVIVQGCDSSQLAVGDIFEVEGKLSPLVVEVTAPRKPCYHVNKRHGTANGANGMQRHALTNSLSGWFTRVLVGGELRDGMKLIRTQHPNPKWTLTYMSNALYNEGGKQDYLMCKAKWNRSKSELQELVDLPQLGNYEWKTEAEKLLKIWKDEADNEEDGKEEKGFLGYFGKQGIPWSFSPTQVKEKIAAYRSSRADTQWICFIVIFMIAMVLK